MQAQPWSSALTWKGGMHQTCHRLAGAQQLEDHFLVEGPLPPDSEHQVPPEAVGELELLHALAAGCCGEIPWA